MLGIQNQAFKPADELQGDLRMQLPMVDICAFCQRWQVQKLYLFGSILRDDFRLDSDVDFLYVLLPEALWSFRNLLQAESELSVIIGRDVDLVSKKSIDQDQNWLRRQTILETARLIYVAP